MEDDRKDAVYGTPQKYDPTFKGPIYNRDKPFLFYFNIVKCANPLVLLEFHCPTPQICVKQCPDRYLTLLSARNTRDFDYYKQFCVPGFQNNKGVTEILRDGECPAVITPSKPLAQRCFPAIHASKGVLMVGNETTYEDGHGARKNITDLVCGIGHPGVGLERTFSGYDLSLFQP